MEVIDFNAEQMHDQKFTTIQVELPITHNNQSIVNVVILYRGVLFSGVGSDVRMRMGEIPKITQEFKLISIFKKN